MVKREIALIPSSFRNSVFRNRPVRNSPVSDAKGCGLEREVWPRPVSDEKGAELLAKRVAERKREEEKKMCV